MKSRFLTLTLIVAITLLWGSFASAAHQAALPAVPAGETIVVRVYYPDLDTGNKIRTSFEAHLLGGNSEAGYYILQVTQDDIDRLATAGLRVERDETPVAPTALPPDASPEEARTLEDVEAAYHADYLHLATGNPLAVPAARAKEFAETTEVTLDTHATYAWPFTVQSMGHAIQSYQNYSNSPYFHHGIDIMAPNGTGVFNRSGGQVINVENYQPGNALYWEVAVLDPEGYIWQYHHIDRNTIPQAIRDKFAQYQADPVNGGFIAPNTYIGNIVYWTVTSFGYRFNHIHLNILGAGGVYLNGFEFHDPLADTTAPVVQAIGLLKNNTVQTGNTVSGDYGLYVRSRDLVLSPVYYLPPYQVDFAVDGGPVTTVWEFANLPGGASDTDYVTDYYVVPPTCGNYTCRDFYIDLGFTTSGQRTFPACDGSHTVNVTTYDYAGNSATGTFAWTVTGGQTADIAPTLACMDFETLNPFYRIVTTNSGPCSATDVQIIDTLPSGAVYNSYISQLTTSNGTVDQGSCTVSGQTVTCHLLTSLPTTASDSTAKWTVDIRVKGGTGDSWNNSVTASISTRESNTTNNTATTTCVPTAVELKSFTARGVNKAVYLAWETASETDNLGFNLYRATAIDGKKTKLNAELIPSLVPPGSTVGASYSYLDTAAEKGVRYYYWLEMMDIYSKTDLHGPVQAQVAGDWQIYLPTILRR